MLRSKTMWKELLNVIAIHQKHTVTLNVQTMSVLPYKGGM